VRTPDPYANAGVGVGVDRESRPRFGDGQDEIVGLYTRDIKAQIKERSVAKQKQVMYACWAMGTSGATAAAAMIGQRKDVTGINGYFEKDDNDEEVDEEYKGLELQVWAQVEDREVEETLRRPTRRRHPCSLFSPAPSSLSRRRRRAYLPHCSKSS
jgi:hypothetical protein